MKCSLEFEQLITALTQPCCQSCCIHSLCEKHRALSLAKNAASFEFPVEDVHHQIEGCLLISANAWEMRISKVSFPHAQMYSCSMNLGLEPHLSQLLQRPYAFSLSKINECGNCNTELTGAF